MADPASLSASVFAVLGFADVAIRAGNECCRFLSAIRDAPSRVQSLRHCVEETALLAESSKRYCAGLKSSSSATASDQVIAQFTSALRALNREFSALEALSKRYIGSTTSWGKINGYLMNGNLTSPC